MKWIGYVLINIALASALELKYLDPTKLQTNTPAFIQQDAATKVISKYTQRVKVEVDPIWFHENKDIFKLKTTNDGLLHIRASTGVAALWGFNYYLKKYCKSQVDWQVKNVRIPSPLPAVNEAVVANDRFRYYQNVCTASYSFVWWDVAAWQQHVEWMALNGINLALAPAAQEAAWARIYKRIGMTDDEIEEHFTGPAFLTWLRMGNVHGWGGPLLKSWHKRQEAIQFNIIGYMYQLGMVPVLPAFNGHVPRAFKRIYPNSTFHSVQKWNKFDDDYCCGLFLDPTDVLFKQIGGLFLREVTSSSGTSHIYSADPFNEVQVQPWSIALVQETTKSIFAVLNETDDQAVWLIQNWMFVHDPDLWPKILVKSLLTSVPNGRMLVLDLQSEQWPQYDLYEMYFGQPFIWCMLHNFGGTLGMFGNTQTINKDVYKIRSRVNNTMLGIGLTPEGINQNYVVYDLMLESAWRKGPVELETWVENYAERRYGCNSTGRAWRYLLKSVYSFDGLNRIRGKYVITKRPSMRLKPWAWYKSHDLIEAWRTMVYSDTNCNSEGFYYDLVDITRQVLQYRAEQIYLTIKNNQYSNTWVFNSTIVQFLDIMNDLEEILATNNNFLLKNWLVSARSIAVQPEDVFVYEQNARNQITLWGPNGEITDYACKQWAEMFHHYYTPRWRMFLSAALQAKVLDEFFDEKGTQEIVRQKVERPFITTRIVPLPQGNPRTLAAGLFEKWAILSDMPDLPNNIIKRSPLDKTTSLPPSILPYYDEDDNEEADEPLFRPTVLMLRSTSHFPKRTTMPIDRDIHFFD